MENYQRLAARTVNGLQVEPDQDDLRLANFALGMCGEAGEMMALLAEVVWQGECDGWREKLVEESGDCFWYAAAICTVVGSDFNEMLAVEIPTEMFFVGDTGVALLQAAGNVADMVKKYVFHQHPIGREVLLEAVQVYVTALIVLAKVWDVDIDLALAGNIAKL